MPRYPGARWRPISTNHGGRRTKTRAAVLHVDAGGADSLYGWFSNPAAKASSHFYVTYDGVVEQYLDTDTVAWTQREGNTSCIGIETQGKGDGAWTGAQLDAIDALLRWISTTHGVPLVDMGTSRPGARGIGMHRYGIDPWRAPDAETWGPRGKVCPGEARVKQFHTIVIPRLAGSSPRGFLMALSDTQQQQIYDLIVGSGQTAFLERAADVILSRPITLGGIAGDGTKTTTLRQVTGWDDDHVIRLFQAIADVPTKILTAPVARQGGAMTGDTTLRAALAWSDTHTATTQGRIDALEKLVAAGSNLTVEEVQEASRAGVAQALASIETTVTVKSEKGE